MNVQATVLLCVHALIFWTFSACVEEALLSRRSGVTDYAQQQYGCSYHFILGYTRWRVSLAPGVRPSLPSLVDFRSYIIRVCPFLYAELRRGIYFIRPEASYKYSRNYFWARRWWRLFFVMWFESHHRSIENTNLAKKKREKSVRSFFSCNFSGEIDYFWHRSNTVVLYWCIPIFPHWLLRFGFPDVARRCYRGTRRNEAGRWLAWGTTPACSSSFHTCAPSSR